MEKQVVDLETGLVETVPFTEAEAAIFLAELEPEPTPPPAPTLADLQAQLAALQAQISQLAGGA